MTQRDTRVIRATEKKKKLQNNFDLVKRIRVQLRVFPCVRL